MAQVYSTRFHLIAAGGGSGAYLVPAGFLAVIRDVSGVSSSSGAAITVYLNSTIQVVRVQPDASFTVAEGLHWEGRIVALAGDEINVLADVGTSGAYVGGYLLSTP